MSGSSSQKLAGALGQCFADANIQRHFNVDTSFHYYDVVDKNMHIDVMFNQTASVRDDNGNDRILSCNNYFVDIKTASENYGRSCSLPADIHYMKSFLDKDYWLGFVFRDADYISLARITTQFVDTYFHLAQGNTNIYVQMDELEIDDAYSRWPDDYLKVPVIGRDGPTTFNQFYAAEHFTGHELDGKNEKETKKYVETELWPFCEKHFGRNNDI